MTLEAYNVYTQYQRTQLSYEAKITPVNQNELQEKKKNEDGTDIALSSAPVIYTNESDLSNIENIRKQILEKILGGFSSENKEHPLFPNDNFDMKKESYSHGNPYSNGNNHAPNALYYSSNSEYYESTSIEFSAQARIKTPNGEYNIELKFSFTQEYYEKNETEIRIAKENFKNPFDIELDRDDNSLKELKYLHFIFASYKEETSHRVDIFEELRELLTQREKNILDIINKDDEDKKVNTKKLDNFEIWQKSSSQELNLIAAQKDGFGIFLANSKSESSSVNLNVNENGYSLQASYSNSSTTYAEVSKSTNPTTEIEA